MEYGDAMQGYADVAGLRKRVIIVVLPLLTPTHRELVGGPGDADPVGAGAAAGRVAALRRRDVANTTSTPSSRRRRAV